MRPFQRIIICSFFLPLLFVLLLCLNVLQMLSLGLLPFSVAAFRAVNRHFADFWFKALATVLEWFLGVQFLQTGDSPAPGENSFVMANHQSGADIPALIVLACRSGRAGDLKWFVKDSLKWLPGVGWGMIFLDYIFVKRNWNADKEKILATFERLRAHQVPFWILSFVEGTRLKPAKLLRSQEYCRKAGLPVLQQVMSPRTKGFEATLEGLNGIVNAVYDVTIAFEDHPLAEAPGVKELFFGPVQRVHIDLRRFPVENIPRDRQGRVDWILARFSEKNRRLLEFRKTGKLS